MLMIMIDYGLVWAKKGVCLILIEDWRLVYFFFFVALA